MPAYAGIKVSFLLLLKDKIFITLLKIRRCQFVFQMPREPEGKILNCLGVIPIDLRMARNPSELQFSRMELQ